MSTGPKVLAVIPARGGSKGIIRKNLREIEGKSLIRIAAEVCLAVEEISKTVVSTDDSEMALEAERSGVYAPFRRPGNISGDRVGDIPVLQHALVESEAFFGEVFDFVVMVQPTSPLRTAAEVSSVIRECISSGSDAAWTVSRVDSKYHPLKQLRLSASGRLSLWDERGRQIIARQQLTTTYARNGGAYVLRRSALLRGKLLPKNTIAVESKSPMISIDSESDFAMVSEILRMRKIANDIPSD